MWNTYKYTLLSLLRNPGIMVWALAFPIILGTVFGFMFASLDDQADIGRVRIAVVEEPAVSEADDLDRSAFQAFIESMSEGDDALFDVEYVGSAKEAEQLVNDSQSGDDPMTGYVQLVDDEPVVSVVGATGSDVDDVASSVLVMAMDRYEANVRLVEGLFEKDPLAFTDPGFVESVTTPVNATTLVQVTDNQPRESVRYYYALLAMATLFGATLGLVACQQLKANTSALGARREVGATSHGQAVAATIAASWTLSFVCLVIAFLYLEYVIGVDFGGRDLACILVLGVSSLMATSLGCAISAIPRMTEGAKTGLLTAIVCVTTLFAGLYGQPAMNLADMVSNSFPAIDYVNPAVQVAQSFYSIMYYDTYAPLIGHLAIMLAMTVVFFVLAARSLKEHRYASL